jgi:PilZ domain
LETEVGIRSANGSLPGRTLDISESGMSAILPIELQVGETVHVDDKTFLIKGSAKPFAQPESTVRHGQLAG